MSSFGERLRHEREARNTTIEQMGAATGIQLGLLEALERNDFQALPGRAFGKLYIRAYAEVLGFDPQPLIDEYDRERQAQVRAPEPSRPELARPRRAETVIARWREARIAERSRQEPTVAAVEIEQEEPAETVEAREAAPIETGREEAADGGQEVPVEHEEMVRIRRTVSWPRRLAVVLPLGLLLGAAWIYFAARSQEEIPAPAPAAVELVRVPPPNPAAEAAPAPPPAQPAVESPIDPPRLAVPEFGVGRRIVGRRLDGQGDRFAEGEVVRFATRVIGGEPGLAIRHVWLHEGRVVQSIRLTLGRRDWHTHSSKTLRQRGAWTVEARDGEGRVLARATFTCGPAGS